MYTTLHVDFFFFFCIHDKAFYQNEVDDRHWLPDDVLRTFRFAQSRDST